MDHGSILRRSGAVCASLLAAMLASPVTAQQGDDAGQGDDTGEADARSDPRSCLNQTEIRRATILNDRNIVFVTRFDEIYNNQLPKQCPGLNRRSLVNYAVANRRICAGDRFQVLWEPQPGNYLPAALCPLGAFVPITEAELEDLRAMTEENRETNRSRGRSRREAVTTEQIELPPDPPATAETTSAETPPTVESPPAE
jgi:hypothetical protein